MIMSYHPLAPLYTQNAERKSFSLTERTEPTESCDSVFTAKTLRTQRLNNLSGFVTPVKCATHLTGQGRKTRQTLQST